MATKQSTNESVLKQLIKELDQMELALLRERIIHMMEITKKSIENEPEKWEKSFMHPSMYLKLGEKVNNIIGFKD